MANVTGKVRVIADGSQVPTSLPGTTTSASNTLSLNGNFGTSGTTADEVDSWYSTTLTLVASTPQTIDLTALTGVYGQAVNMARVRRIVVNVLGTTDAATVTLSPGASNGWTALLGTGSTLVLRHSSAANPSILVLAAPNTTGWVTSGTSKTLKFDPGTTATTVAVDIMGCSA